MNVVSGMTGRHPLSLQSNSDDHHLKMYQFRESSAPGRVFGSPVSHIHTQVTVNPLTGENEPKTPFFKNNLHIVILLADRHDEGGFHAVKEKNPVCGQNTGINVPG